MLLRGVALVGPDERPWSLVLKGFTAAATRDNSANDAGWKCGWRLYDSGLLDGLPAGLRAPRCYRGDETGDV